MQRLTAGLIALVLATACSGPKSTSAAATPGARRNLLLVTLDTVRADHLGVYGASGARDSTAGATPALDALARRGVRFAHADATVPLTLPSHATLLTGLLPLHHGLRQNGAGALDPGIDTLATALSRSGYRTAAFVGAFVLDRRFGLARGFETYDDEIDRRAGEPQALEAERSGRQVVDRALAWLAQDDRRPFFLWVHLYDAHAPYEPPEPFRSRFSGDPYTGEVAEVDAEVARLVGELERRGLTASTVVAAVGDHGEALGEHGELTHGLLLYEGTLAVPWILVAPGELPAGTISTEPVSTVDLAPTVAGLVGAVLRPPQGSLDGRDLTGALAAGAALPRAAIYAETEYPKLFGWSALAALRSGPDKLIASPAPELFDLDRDPGEARNLLSDKRRETHTLTTQLAALRATATAEPAAAPADAETRARLASLGYVTGSPPSGPSAPTTAPDPKAMVALFRRLEEAKTELDLGRSANAAAQLEALLAADPQNPVFAQVLAGALRKSGQTKRAVPLYRQAVRAHPESVEGWYDLATALQETGETAEAIVALGEAIRRDPGHPEAHNAMGLALLARREPEPALAEFRRATELDSRNATAWNNLGNAARELGRADESAAAYRRATIVAPRFADPWNGLGALEVSTGHLAEAVASFDRALELDPRKHEVRLNRAIAWDLAGDRGRAAGGYRDFLAASRDDPQFATQREAARKLLTRVTAPLAEDQHAVPNGGG